MNFILGVFLSWTVFLGLSITAFAQVKLKLEDIDEKIKVLEETKADEELIAIWRKVSEFKIKLAASEDKTEKNTVVLSALERKKEQLETLKFDQDIIEPTSDLTLADVSAKVDQLNAEKDSATLNISTLKQLEVDRATRTGLIPGLIRESKTKLEAIQPLEKVDSSDEQIDKAKYQRDSAQRDFLQQYILELGLEQKIIEIGAPVLKVETRIAEQKSVYYSGMLEIWKKRLDILKAKESATDKERIKQQIIDFSEVPLLKKIADDNLLLLEQLEEVRESSTLDSSNNRLSELNTKLMVLKTNKEYAENRFDQLESAGLSVDTETGLLLREQATILTSDKELNNQIKKVSGAYTKTQLGLLKLKNKRSELPNNTEEFLNDLSDEMKLRDVNVDEARQLITEQNKLLTELVATKRKIASIQKSQIVVLNETVAVTASYSKYINERLIWIASTEVIKVSDFPLEASGVSKIFADGYVSKWIVKLKVDFLEHTVLWSIALLVFGFLVWKFKHYKSLVCAFHKRARRRNCQSFKPTLKGVFLEMITALPMPLIFGFLSWRSSGMPIFEKSFFVAAVFSFLAGLAWSYSRSDGLIVSNFKLNERQSKIIHNTMAWFLPTMLPLLMLFIALIQPSLDPLGRPEQYGRILYIITMGLTMLAFVQLFRPKYQLLNNSNAECKIAKIIFGICMLVPTILIIGACLGYFASAIILRNQFIASVWTIVVSMFIAALLNRWFLVSSRKLAIKQALKRREAMIKERENQEADDPESKIVTKSAEEVEAEAVNVTGVKEQTTRLVKVTLICSIVFSLWGIWSQSLPALSILDKQKLWEHSANSSKSESKASSNPLSSLMPGSSSTSEPAPEEIVEVDKVDDKEDWVSLQDLLFSFIIFILTYIAASNIPGLLEITVLDNLNIKSGAAFALTTTVRYLIVLFGIIWAFGNIGVTWSSIQWIAAAVTLGIGFGLQEVFANFVAGLILLYERPIRLGDVVTVGEVSGRVTKIKIRATTVHQFNNHELIVPNKEFITGQLINWTLSDNIIRSEVLVGIAYGSDTQLAKKILLKVAQDHPKVLKTHKPDVLFTAFGSSSLDFKLRCFVAGYDDLIPTQSELHFQVNDAFAEAGIEISFPQQDLHIKSVEEAIPLKLAKMIEE